MIKKTFPSDTYDEGLLFYAPIYKKKTKIVKLFITGIGMCHLKRKYSSNTVCLLMEKTNFHENLLKNYKKL
jgi:hypothetical protein